MRVRVYFPFVPFPITEGAHLVVSDQIQYLASAGHQVELVVWNEDADSFLTKQQSFEQQSGAHWKLLRGRRERLWARYARVGRSLVTKLASPELFHYPPALTRELDKLEPVDLAIYHYSYAYSWLCRCPLLPAEKKRVVHLHNIESMLHRLRGGRARVLHEWNAKKLERHEMELRSLADELWFLSEQDTVGFGDATIRVVPPTFQISVRKNRSAGDEEDVVLGFIGAMNFKPNYESVRWILREVAPLLSKCSFTGRILIAGKEPQKDLRELGANYRFVEFCGFVEQLDQFWRRLSFLLAPHIVGSGVRTKILEAMASGIPVITNTAGQKLLPNAARNDPFLVCLDDPKDWAAAISREASPYQTKTALMSVPTSIALLASTVYADVA